MNQEETSQNPQVAIAYENEIKWPDWIVAVFTIVIAVVGFYQWRAINGQIGEMQASGKQTDRLIFLYQQQLAQMQSQTTNTRDLVGAGKLQATNTGMIAKTGIETSRLDERAWFGVADTEIMQYDPHDSTKPIQFKVMLKNTGKTPARQIHGLGMFTVYPTRFASPTDKDWKIFLDYFNKSKDRYAAAPNSTRNLMVDTTGDATDITYMDYYSKSLENHSLFLYYYGQITYIDLYNREHSTKFCFWFSDSLPKQLAHCGAGNDMD